MELRDRQAVVDVGRRREEYRQGGDEIEADRAVVEVASANLVLGAHVPIDGGHRVVGVVVSRGGEGERADGNRLAAHRHRVGGGAGDRYVLLEDTQVGLADAAQIAESREARAGGCEHRLAGLRGLAERVVLEITEVEQLVLADRTADGGAQAVVVEARIGADAPAAPPVWSTAFRLRFCRYSKIEPWIWLVPVFTMALKTPPDAPPNSALNWFCTTLNCETASLETYTCGPRGVVVVVHHAVDVEGVVLGALSGDARAGALADAAGAGHTRAQQAEVVDPGAVYDLGNTRRGHVDGGPGIVGRSAIGPSKCPASPRASVTSTVVLTRTDRQRQVDGRRCDSTATRTPATVAAAKPWRAAETS